MSFEFIQELSEARLFRNPTKVNAITSSQLADNFYNAVLAVQTMHLTDPKAAQKYASNTFLGGSEGWRSSGSDLHNMAYMLENPEHFREKVSTDRFVTFPKLQYKTWLRNLTNGKVDKEFDRRFLLRLQKDLGINNIGLKSARRMLADWDTADMTERKTAAARIFQGLNHNLKMSDIFMPYTKSATRKNLLPDNIDTPQKKGLSLPAKMGIAAVGGYLAGKSIAKL